MKTKSIVIMTMFVFLFPFLIIAQEVRVEANTRITIESGTTMDLTTGDLVLESDVSGDVSLIVLGAVEINDNGKTNAERYLPGSEQAWHFLSAPVGGMAISGSVFEPGDNDDFYAWDEPSPGTWSNYKNTTVAPIFSVINGGDNFVAAKGYLLAFNEANPTKTFSGDLQVGDLDFTLKNSSSDKDYSYNEGWNLMANPYSSAIDWNDATRSQFQDDFAYVYDPAAGGGGGGFIDIDGSSADAFIAANQGFFVHAITGANNQSFTFTNAMQAHGGTFYKSKAEDEKLVLRLTGDQFYDETTIRKRDESTFSKDRVDAYNMNSFNVNAPNIYSISSDNVNLSVNSIPQIGTENNIRIGFTAPKNGLYTIKVVEASSYMMDYNIYLEDLMVNTLHKISDSDYSFTTDAGEIDDRFVLHFGITDINNDEEPDMLNIWVYNNKLFIVSEIKQARLEIFDMQGSLMSSKTINVNGKYSETLNFRSGIYVVRLQNGDMVESNRITIK